MWRVVRNALIRAAEQLPRDAHGVVVIGLRFLPEAAVVRSILDEYFQDRERFPARSEGCRFVAFARS